MTLQRQIKVRNRRETVLRVIETLKLIGKRGLFYHVIRDSSRIFFGGAL